MKSMFLFICIFFYSYVCGGGSIILVILVIWKRETNIIWMEKVGLARCV